jgi:hypothetical protein
MPCSSLIVRGYRASRTERSLRYRCITEPLMAKLGRSLDDRFCSIEDFASILGERRINPVAVDSLLGPLGRGTYRCDRSFPPLGIDGPPKDPSPEW